MALHFVARTGAETTAASCAPLEIGEILYLQCMKGEINIDKQQKYHAAARWRKAALCLSAISINHVRRSKCEMYSIMRREANLEISK